MTGSGNNLPGPRRLLENLLAGEIGATHPDVIARMRDPAVARALERLLDVHCELAHLSALSSRPDLEGDDACGADAAPMRAATNGDAEACEALARRLACIGRLAGERNEHMQHGLDREDLDDVLQDVAANVWEHRDRYRGATRLEAWVFSFCDRELRTAARRKRRRLGASLPLEQYPAPRSPMDTTFADRLRDCVRRLDAAEQAIVRGRHDEGLSLRELAVRHDCSVEAMKSRYFHALQLLRACLDGKGDR